MVQPFIFERPFKIDISIPGYDARHQVQILGKKMQKLRPKAALTNNADTPPTTTTAPTAVARTADDGEILALNSALQANSANVILARDLQEIFDEEVGIAHADHA